MAQQNITLQGVVAVTQNDTDTFSKEAAFYFDIIQEHSVSIQNQITDNYLENNTAVADHIAQAPLVVTLRGLIGELVYTPVDYKPGKLQENKTWLDKLGYPITDKLGPITSIFPEVSNIDQLARNAAQYVDASIKRYKNIYNSYFGKKNTQQAAPTVVNQQAPKETRLQEVYRKLMVLRTNNALFTVITPYTETSYPLTDMAIQSVTLRQGNENFVSDVEITLKQIKFAKTETTKPNTEVMALYNATPRTAEANHGKSQGVTVNSESLIRGIVNKYNPDLKGKGRFYGSK